MRVGRPTLVWLLLSATVAGYLGFSLRRPAKVAFLPGPASDGHHQIEVACTTCHTPFGGVPQAACLDCHAAELERAQDSHSVQIFSDPRHADDLAKVDARRCVVCHTEHRPEITAPMGVTLPPDFCAVCHGEVARERPTHRDFPANTCASAGCHNYHDNRALYENFLAEHAVAQAATFPGRLPEREPWVAHGPGTRTTLSAADADGPVSSAPELVAAWAGSAHAAGGVSCSDCHRSNGAEWVDHPPRDTCASCHQVEPEGFLAGKHGMRISAGLDPVSPSMARLPMRAAARSEILGCNSCHDVHAIDVQRAAVDACVSCHADEHSESYPESPHGRVWLSEVAGASPPGSGVSCSSCHLPRVPRRVAGDLRTVVEHNQNDNLRPNEKMIRDVCLHCHSLAFSLDALADPDLIRRNFAGTPAGHIESIDMVLSRRNDDAESPP